MSTSWEWPPNKHQLPKRVVFWIRPGAYWGGGYVLCKYKHITDQFSPTTQLHNTNIRHNYHSFACALLFRVRRHCGFVRGGVCYHLPCFAEVRISDFTTCRASWPRLSIMGNRSLFFVSERSKNELQRFEIYLLEPTTYFAAGKECTVGVEGGGC